MGRSWDGADDPAYITHGFLLDLTAEILRAMEEQGVSRAELARRVGVPRQRVTNFLNTPSNTTLLTIVRFAQALGLEVDVVLHPSRGKGAETTRRAPSGQRPAKLAQAA